ncbi:hypothetical protein LTR91_009017 [Friedmanniomyces endolithicus]|uniref:Ubiquitin-like modifier HUB1 n=1 Tax=Friedmanniomyces endolithicus TaxID=329885 RepID=A0AAN6QUA0_9PEZI|nr:hypothetical protein LTR01_000530 [Friedmanniomyces endolithicus]KAK0327986.1 hypothetical protein LTR82_001505 [Friedmanniomyces endolithicus]KAK0834956.1 hypothetical protein LTR73_001248 [Friedmanniomyces endolithicus]KAK0918265.1 hypothetical protein LTR57_011936 [Friedmanniomyces endolithicus]KAK0989989.1 hypothetical protein LTR54_012214 [Friedmanniomyces endolithicus]
MSDRERSASPLREPKAKKQKTTGFKWKDAKPRNDDPSQDARDSGRLERGYRNRSPRRASNRNRDEERCGKDDGERAGVSAPPQDKLGGSKPSQPSNDSAAVPVTPSAQLPEPKRDPFATAPSTSNSNPTTIPPKKQKKPRPPPAPTGPTIIVHINDRLGTKASIPCLASDSIRAFKALVAMQIGRQPHEILLKRQGERPFKDALTLEDYGLDLELDTGD